MKISTFKTTKVTPYANGDNCGLPMSILAIIAEFVTERMLTLPRGLTEEYMHCGGLGSKLLNNEWGAYVAKFPWLIAILVCSACLPLLCIVWCFFQFRRARLRRFERSPVSTWRYILSTLLFLLKIVYCFFLWFTYISYQNHPVRSIPERNDNQMNIFYDRTLDVVDYIFTENIEVVQEFMKQLADDMKSNLNRSAPKILQDPSESMLLKMYAESNSIQPLVQSMQADMELLLADFMQLLDITRFFYRNTTTFLILDNISDPAYTDLIYNELKANEHKILTLLNVERVLSTTDDIVEMSIGFPRLCEAFTKSLAELHSYYETYLTHVWTEKVKEMEENYVEINTALRKLQSDLPENIIIHLPSDIYSYQLIFLIIALMIALLCFMQLCYALYHTVAMRFKKKKYILVSIVVVICTSSIILCLIASLSFFVGTSYFNFRQETTRLENPCGLDTQSYCDAHDRVLSILDADTEAYKKDMDIENQRVFESLRSLLPSVAGISNILHMVHYAGFSGYVFNSGTMFNVVKQELNMENWYGAYERLSSHVNNTDTATTSTSSTGYQTMLACNVNTMKLHVFETLIAKDITDNVNGLSKNSELLATLLPVKNLTTLLKQSLSEMRALHDFFETDLRILLDKLTVDLLWTFKLEMRAYRSHLALIPDCLELKLPSVGMPRDLYECIENRLHGFWIGAFAILILLFPILIICMLLAYLYDRYPYSSQSRRSSRSSQPSAESSPTGSTTSAGEGTADDESVSEPETPKKFKWRDMYGPRVRRSRVTFNAAQKKTKRDRDALDKVPNARRSSGAKIRDLINSVINSSSNEPPDATTSTKSSTNASTSPEASEEA